MPVSRKKTKTKKKKASSSKYLFIKLLACLIIIFFVGTITYGKFAIWDASNPTQDHAWYNLMLFPFTPTLSDHVAYTMLKNDPSIVHIDVRDQKEYDAGHIPGALNISEDTLYSVIPQKYPDKNQLIYLNCNTGHKGAVSTRLLRSMGYTNVWNIEGGLTGWKRYNYPVVK